MQLFRLQAREEKRRILYIKLQNFQHIHAVWQVQREMILIFPLGGQTVVFFLITIAASVLCQVLPGVLCSLRGQRADGVSDTCFLREGWCGKRACCGWRACHFLNGTQIIARLGSGFVRHRLQMGILRGLHCILKTSSAVVVMLQESFTLTGFWKHISKLRIYYSVTIPVKEFICLFAEAVLCNSSVVQWHTIL